MKHAAAALAFGLALLVPNEAGAELNNHRLEGWHEACTDFLYPPPMECHEYAAGVLAGMRLLKPALCFDLEALRTPRFYRQALARAEQENIDLAAGIASVALKQHAVPCP
ncbi:MAG: hypothetical protein ACE5Q3_15875 [Alphaproteobacteria bacterium]